MWKIVSKSEEIIPYIRCAFCWLEFVQKYYTERETMILLADLSNKLQNQLNLELPENILRQIETIITSMISNSTSMINNTNHNNVKGYNILTSEYLLIILDIFKGNRKVSLCKVSQFIHLYIHSFI